MSNMKFCPDQEEPKLQREGRRQTKLRSLILRQPMKHLALRAELVSQGACFLPKIIQVGSAMVALFIVALVW